MTTDVEEEIDDFGVATWRGRRVQAVLVSFQLKAEHRVIGEYNEKCLILGYLIDAEFSMFRDAYDGECADVDAKEAWLVGHDFESYWNPTPS